MDINKRIRTAVVTMLICFVAAIGIFQPVNVAAATSDMTLSVKGTTALPGDTVQVQIYLENNPGLASLKFDVAYDDVLTLTRVEFNSNFGAYVTAPTPYKNPQSISFISPLTEVNASGVFATLTFLVSPDAPDQYDATVSLICDDENIFDGDYNSIATTAVNGKIHIVHGYPGDINGDRAVNNKDAILLFQYVAGMNVEVDADALDVNGDGKVNNRDAVLLFRYVAGWDVEIGRGPATTVCQHGRTEILSGYAPTCTQTGLTNGQACADCGTVLVEQQTISAKGHLEVRDTAIAATCTTPGKTEGKHCSVCGTVLVAQQTIPAKGHTYVNGVCHCGDRDPNYVKNYTVIFVDYNGNVLSKQTVQEGSNAQAPSNPQREGYTFIGWDKSFNKVTSDITVTAMYEKIATGPQFIVSNNEANRGDTIEVTVALKNNPGIASIILATTFDSNALTLTGVTYNNTIGGQTVPPQAFTSPVNLYWVNGFANATGDFVLATLTFKVSDTAAAGKYEISLSYQPDNVYDITETNILFEIVKGSVTVG